MVRSLVVVFGLLLMSFAGPASAQSNYAVIGVAQDDVLNMRARPPVSESLSSIPVIGSIPSGAGGVAGTTSLGSSRQPAIKTSAQQQASGARPRCVRIEVSKSRGPRVGLARRPRVAQNVDPHRLRLRSARAAGHPERD